MLKRGMILKMSSQKDFQGIEDLEFIHPEMILVEWVATKWNIPIQW